MADSLLTYQSSASTISPDILAQIQENPVVGKSSVKPAKTMPIKPAEKVGSSSLHADSINPFITVILGVLALAAGILTVLVIANYARLH